MPDAKWIKLDVEYRCSQKGTTVMIAIIHGPTPNGGDFALAFFKDENGRFISKRKALRIEIHEYTYDGVDISTSFMSREEPTSLLMRIKNTMSCLFCRLRGDNGWENEEFEEFEE